MAISQSHFVSMHKHFVHVVNCKSDLILFGVICIKVKIQIILLISFPKGAVYKVYNSGPTTEPFGTPYGRVSYALYTLLIL